MQLNSGFFLPSPGLGTFTTDVSLVKDAVKTSLKVGYRHIDTASRYANEEDIGKALKEAIEEKIVKREDVFIVSKLWSTKHKKEDVKPELKASLDRLQVDYLDLYLIHWPISFQAVESNPLADEHGNLILDKVSHKETWQAMEECVKEGLVRSIGLSNFNSAQIKEIMKDCKIKPSVLQVELHPYLQQTKLLNFCKDNGIVLTAYSPLGSPGRPWSEKGEKPMLEDEVLVNLAKKKGKSVAQVILNWICHRGIVPLAKSTTAKRILENFQISNFDLSEEEMNEISKLDRNKRYCLPSDFYPQFDWTKVEHYPFNIEF